MRNHPFIASAKEMAIFTDVIYADKVGGSKKVQSYADVIHGWSLRMMVEKL